MNLLRLDPGNAAAIRQLGLVLFEQGQYPQAFAFLDRAKPTDPNNLSIRAKLGFGALIARNLGRAREEAVFILSKQPTNEEAFILLADAAEAAEVQQTRKLLEAIARKRPALPDFMWESD